jgi:hypothetical protein
VVQKFDPSAKVVITLRRDAAATIARWQMQLDSHPSRITVLRQELIDGSLTYLLLMTEREGYFGRSALTAVCHSLRKS